MIEEFNSLVSRLREVAPSLSARVAEESGHAVIRPELDDLRDTLSALADTGFDRLGFVTVVDRIEHFELVHRLSSRALSAAVFVKTVIPRDTPKAPSAFGIWPAALWPEREVFDLFGVEFEGHPDMTRIFLPEDFEGHPLRKDFEDPQLIRRPDYI